MPSTDRIYLDNAATTFPKPAAVAQAVFDEIAYGGGSAGRGGHRSAVRTARIIERTRGRLAELFDCGAPERFAFTLNATDSLNAAIRGVLSPGDHVIASLTDHNSVVRPLQRAMTELGVTVTWLTPSRDGLVSADLLQKAISSKTRLVIVNHASNVTGLVQPLPELAQIVEKTPALLLVDAAQTAGLIPISLRDIPIDLLACAGHKGLYGPLGVGVLYAGPKADRSLLPWRAGGTGTASELPEHPLTYPQRLEAGNPNVPGIAGLLAALETVQTPEFQAKTAAVGQLFAHFVSQLEAIELVSLYGSPENGQGRASSNWLPIVTLNIDGFDPHELSGILDNEFGIESRAGLHCAPLMHQFLGTAPEGAVRLSASVSTAAQEISIALDSIRQVAGG
jgi:cysteine desulfurase / selenocysteine lyase